MEQEGLLKKIAAVLQKLDVPYVITGGIAVSVWGRIRFTADIDIAIELLPQKLDALADALLKIDKDVYVDRNMMSRALARKGEFNFIHPDSRLKVDFWVLGGGSFDREEINRKIPRTIAGQTIFFISPEDLIVRKLLWHKESQSDRQLDDVTSILNRQKRLDVAYLRRWAKKHSISRLLEALLKKSKR